MKLTENTITTKENQLVSVQNKKTGGRAILTTTNASSDHKNGLIKTFLRAELMDCSCMGCFGSFGQSQPPGVQINVSL